MQSKLNVARNSDLSRKIVQGSAQVAKIIDSQLFQISVEVYVLNLAITYYSYMHE